MAGTVYSLPTAKKQNTKQKVGALAQAAVGSPAMQLDLLSSSNTPSRVAVSSSHQQKTQSAMVSACSHKAPLRSVTTPQLAWRDSADTRKSKASRTPHNHQLDKPSNALNPVKAWAVGSAPNPSCSRPLSDPRAQHVASMASLILDHTQPGPSTVAINRLHKRPYWTYRGHWL
jgi:hypothetical protein